MYLEIDKRKKMCVMPQHKVKLHKNTYLIMNQAKTLKWKDIKYPMSYGKLNIEKHKKKNKTEN